MRSRLLAVLALLYSAGPALAGHVTVSEGWFRLLPASLPSAGYFILRNLGDKPLALVGVESPACGMLMMHRSVNGGMDHVTSVPLAAGETLTFAPHGYHLMCMGATAMLRPLASVPVTFAFDDGTRVMATFKVRDARGK